MIVKVRLQNLKGEIKTEAEIDYKEFSEYPNVISWNGDYYQYNSHFIEQTVLEKGDNREAIKSQVAVYIECLVHHWSPK